MEIPLNFNHDSCAERVLRRIALQNGAHEAALLLVNRIPFGQGGDEVDPALMIRVREYQNAFVFKTLYALEKEVGEGAALELHFSVTKQLRRLVPALFGQDFMVLGPGGGPGSGDGLIHHSESAGIRTADLAALSGMAYQYGEEQAAFFGVFCFGRRGILCK